MNTKRLIEIAEQVAIDAENDASEFDGKPFTGKTVAQYFGNHGAAIAALANIIKEILKDAETVEGSDTTVLNSNSKAK